MRGQEALFSRATDEWYTPQDFYQKLDSEFSFTLDPCATAENAKTETFFTIDDDGLTKDWHGHSVFINPPYSKIKDWVKKCAEEAKKPGTRCVMLIPSRTDTRWFHEFIYNKAEVRFLKGRLKFGGAKWNAPFPNMLVIF